MISEQNNDPLPNFVSSNKGVKELLTKFFQSYCWLMDIVIKKISKYHCDKKLKYLIETVGKQIFTEIMFLAYELKMEHNSCSLSAERKGAFTLSKYLKMIIHEKGNLIYAFKTLKTCFCKEVKND